MLKKNISKYNFAIIGCGRISRKYVEIFRNNKIENIKLVSVCDINLEKAKKIGEEFKISYYEDFHSMIKHEDIDVVVVSTPSGMHAKHVIEIAKYRKHIIVEKPMALKISDAKKMIKKCSENNVQLFVVKQNRFNKPVQELRNAIINKKFGKLVLGTVRVRWCRKQDYYNQDSWRGTWALDGGVISNQAIHHLDLLLWMLGDVESVFAKGSTALSKIEAEDTAVAVLKFKSGALGVIEATTATRPRDIEGSISILGEKGTVEIGGFAVNEIKIWNFTNESEEISKKIKKFSVHPTDVYGFGHEQYLKHVVDCIDGRCKPLVDGLEGIKSLKLIVAMYNSMENRKEIFLDKPLKKCKLGNGK